MAETGDWVTPRLYGQPWFEKPPLYYWGAAISFKVFGVSDAAARLPSAVSALLATLALAWLAWRLFGGETARWLLLLLPASVGMIGFSHAAATDMPFSGMLTMAMVAAAAVLGLDAKEGEGVEGGREVSRIKRWLALTAFGFFLGAAVLAKGPAAVILSGGAVFFWAVFTKRWRDAFRLLHPAALVAFFATALPWYLLCARRNPDFFRVFIIEHNFKRFLTPEFRHEQPFWFYLPVIFIGLVPWSALFAGIGRPFWNHPRSGLAAKPNFIYACSWALFPVLFFTLSKSKLPGYVLPAIPALAFLLAQVVAFHAGIKDAASRWVIAGIGVLLLALGIAWMIFENRIPDGQDIIPAPWKVGMSAGLIAGGLTVTILALYGKRVAALIASVLTLLYLLTTLYGALYWLDPVYSARSAPHDAQVAFPDFSQRDACVFHLQRGHHYALNYYLHHELPECSFGAGQRQLIFTSYKETARLEALGKRCLLYIVFPAVIPCVDKAEGHPSNPK